VSVNPPFALDEVLGPYRSGDLDECVRILRQHLDANPFALTPRHFLAHVLTRLDQVAIARVHYEKMLPVAVGRGELFRALAIQHRLDEIEGRGTASRYAAMHRWFRLLGEANLAPAPDRTKPAITAPMLLRMPVDAFVHVAGHLKVERFEPEPTSEPIESQAVWHMLWGAMRWRLVVADGRVAAEGRLDEGHQLGGHGVPMRGRLLCAPETPGEWLHLEPSLVARVTGFDPRTSVDPTLTNDIVREERLPIQHGQRPPSDLDRGAPEPQRALGNEPPRLDLTTTGFRITGDRDTGDWMEHGQLDLGGDTNAEDSGAGEDDVPMLELGAMGAPPPPQVEAAPSPGDAEVRPQRRADPRVPVSFTARVALLGIGRPETETLTGDVVDLSVGGVGLRFPRAGLQRALTMLRDEALRVDLITLGGGFLQLAGRARWVDFGADDAEVVSVGVQFALLTEADRESLARLVMEADPGLDTRPSAA